MLFIAAMPLCRYAVVPLCRCTVIPLYRCAIIPLCHCAVVPLRHCAVKSQADQHLFCNLQADVQQNNTTLICRNTEYHFHKHVSDQATS